MMKKRSLCFVSLMILATTLIAVTQAYFFTADAAKKTLAEQVTIRLDSYGTQHLPLETKAATAFAMARTQAETSTVEIQQVQKAAEKFVDAFVNLDWERFQACWAADATLFHPFADLPRRLRGRDEIVASFKNRFEDLRKQKPKPPYLNIQPKDLEVTLLGGAALVTFHLGGETTQGRRTLILQKQGNEWLIIHLHASTLTLPAGEKK